ncbi:hypothetical protein ACEWY4_021491 [Coilia grayii]|uniref:HAT C-terminal dimerisation domain-containing protein n=1 Tax=Coilia grayii TaxID=363190 RepID=A0ABD1JCF9_9TELE
MGSHSCLVRPHCHQVVQDARILELTDEHWIIMADLRPILQTLKCATTIMSSENAVSISHIYPITYSIINKHLAITADDGHRVAEFKRTVRKERVFDKLKQLCANMDHVTETDEEDVPFSAGGEDGPTAGPSNETTRRDSAMHLLLGDDYSESGATDPQLEVDVYAKESRPSLDSKSLEWWRANQSRFPQLASLAERYLCIPGTSVPSERVFSTAGLVVNRLLTQLTPEHVDMLVFLNKNN